MRSGRRNSNGAACDPGPALSGVHGATVHFGEALDHGEPDAEPALRAVERPVALNEQLEDVREQEPSGCRRRCRDTRITPSPPSFTRCTSMWIPPSGSVYFAELVSTLTTH